MLIQLKNWSTIILSLTLVFTLFQLNALIIQMSKQANEIEVPAQAEETQRVCLSLSLIPKEEVETTDMIEELPNKNL